MALLERTLPGEAWVWFENLSAVITQDDADEQIAQWGVLVYWRQTRMKVG
jgi:hypothetical protein